MRIDITSAFKGFTQPLDELIDDLHRRGWTLAKLDVKDKAYLAEGKSPHGEKLNATGNTEATAVANLIVKVMRREWMRSSAIKEKLGAWDVYPIEQQFAQVAIAYASAPVYDPKAASAWMELAQDFQRRAQIIRTQITIEYTYEPIPYESADDLREDVTKKRHILVTRAYSHHPVWSEFQMLDYRVVVDVLGHTLGGGDWGWHGSCLAFAQLAPLLLENPQKALFTELLGQAAFGQFYRQWGPQKIAFLDDLIEKEQKKENKPGSHGVHPSQSIVPMMVPRISAVVGTPKDPNEGWESGVVPLQDNAFLWQRQEGVDPLDIQGAQEALYPLESGIGNMHPGLMRQAVANALRSSLLGARQSPRSHAIHYQTLAGLPADVDDPIAYHDALEQAREQWNTGQGYAPESHKQYWPQEQQLKQWVKATNPDLDDGEVNRLAKRELLHMLMEEEERVISTDQGEQLTAEQIEHEAYESLKNRLKAVTKPNVDQKVDFGDTHLWHEATHHADMFPPYLASRLRPLAQIGRNAGALAEAAREDLLEHGGRGHRFRSAVLSLGIPGIGPRQAATAWLHLAPQTSQLGIVDPHIAETLGHDYGQMSNRDYFKHERELGAARDAAGYNHVPLGAFSTALWDQKAGGPGWHPDRTPYRVYSPKPHHTIDWNAQVPTLPAWPDPYWWNSTQEARDKAGQEFDRSLGTEFGRDEIPFQRTSAGQMMYHMSPAANRESIQQQGLLPVTPNFYQEVDPELPEPDIDSGVYMFDHPNAYDEKWPWQPGQDIWAVDVNGLPLDRDEAAGMNGSWYHSDPIPPDRLRLHRMGSGAHQLNFVPGPTAVSRKLWGRGLIHPDNTIYTWPEEYADHDQMAARLGIEPDDKRYFMVDPTGGFTVHNSTDDESLEAMENYIAQETGLKANSHASWYNRPTEEWKQSASQSRAPWVVHPESGQKLTGPPGTSLMQHIKGVFGHPSVQEVWDQDYQVGKEPAGKIAKTAMAIRTEDLAQYIAEHGPYMYHGAHPRGGGDPEAVAASILGQGIVPNQRPVPAYPGPPADEGFTCPHCGYKNSYDELTQNQDDCAKCGRWVRDALDDDLEEWWHHPRPGHVFMTRDRENAYGKPLFRIDLRKLDPSKLKADDDYLRDHHPRELDFGKWTMPTADNPPRTLGEQAQALNWGNDPDITYKALTDDNMSVLAHEGPIPPEAIERID